MSDEPLFGETRKGHIQPRLSRETSEELTL